jgi:hypothetical protein
MLEILSGFGLASAAGLNAYIPLLTMGIMHRTGTITLAPGYDVIGSWPVLITVGILLIVEIVVDKIPGADHVNDVIQTFVRPTVGALMFSASAGSLSYVPAWLPVVGGLVMAGGVHTAKAAVRPVVNLTTFGLGAPVASVIEDVFATIMSLLAILLPILVILLVIVLGVLIWLTFKWFWGRKASASVAVQVPMRVATTSPLRP